MVYEQFLTALKERMECALGPEYKLALHRIPRNNGLMLDGLCIMKKDSSIAPSIYLNTCYQQFLSGMPLEDIVYELLELYNSSRTPPGLDLQELTLYEAVKDRIAFRLVHAKANRNILNKVPHICWLDLAVVFFLCISQDNSGIITAAICNEHLNIWNISKEDLVKQAFTNTPRLFPYTVTSMASLLEHLNQEDTMAGDPAPFSILSNSSGVYGAGCLVYSNVIKNFADTIEQDIIILPSSIHEVLLLADTGNISYGEMTRLITHINNTEVPKTDQLSNEVYIYSRKLDSISMASKPDAAVPWPAP